MRRVRSSKCGHTERNFRINSGKVIMLRKHTTIAHQLHPLFIYSSISTPQAARLACPAPAAGNGARFGRANSRRSAAGAGAVIDDELLAERRCQALGNHAGLHVGAAAGRIGHDDPHRPLRPGLGLGELRQQHREQ